jgi:hypothetical protein
MKVVNGMPPNFEAIQEAFPLAAETGVMFCFGDYIYAPGRTDVEDRFHAHERVHSIQQGENPSLWWERYLADPVFRLEQEIPAHKAEYECEILGMSRQKRRRALREISAKLASPLYGRMISIGKAKVALLNA